MTEQEVVALMKSSKSKEEWSKNADAVIAACKGYPSFWFSAIILSGVTKETAAKFGEDAEIHII